MTLAKTTKVKFFVQAIVTIRTKLTVRKCAIATFGKTHPIDDIGVLYRREFARMAEVRQGCMTT
ncbi:hypothetical protein [Novipirellula rosea]|uniref:Uncharacterized protein n=1 Tax=Novipirellula rosea TaxID=1031540 RepID=A0ABP8NRA3_9BACT|tara:strand:+ start:1948 stop:2139 length:192 start_codon:yes stop_codon:yes gene_type:complete